MTGSIRRKISKRFLSEGLKVSNWGATASQPVAEAALMMLLMALRRASHWHHVMHYEKGWSTDVRNSGQLSLFKRRIGIHGFGRVAKEFVKLMAPFNTRISTFSPLASNEELEEFGVERMESLEELFTENEIIMEMAALTPETEGSVTERLLRMLPPDAIFVNVGRGAVADEQALAKLAAEGRLRVGLDVFTKEPLPKDSPLRDIPHVILTPHQGGPTADRMIEVGRFAVENIRRYVNGEPISALIDEAQYDLIT